MPIAIATTDWTAQVVHMFSLNALFVKWNVPFSRSLFVLFRHRSNLHFCWFYDSAWRAAVMNIQHFLCLCSVDCCRLSTCTFTCSSGNGLVFIPCGKLFTTNLLLYRLFTRFHFHFPLAKWRVVVFTSTVQQHQPSKYFQCETIKLTYCQLLLEIWKHAGSPYCCRLALLFSLTWIVKMDLFAQRVCVIHLYRQ